MLRASKSNILKDADEGNVFLGIKNMTAHLSIFLKSS